MMPRTLQRLRQPRTATLLLLALAAAAAVATAVPQQPVAPRTVAAWRDGSLGPGRDAAQVLDALGLFDITGSWWWTLLVVVIVVASCWWLGSGWGAFAREWRGPPPRRAFGPSTVATARRGMAADAEAVRQATETVLRRRGYRVWSRQADAHRTIVIAERGRLRTAATLTSHAAVPLLLLGLVAAQAFAFTGQVDVVEGDSVAETPVAYDRVEHGPLWRASDHRGFTLTLDDFDVAFHPDGTPDDFVARIRLDDGQPVDVRINHPLRTEGMMISLLRYGVAPHLLVRDRDGTTVFDGPVRLAEAERTWAGTTTLHAGGRYLLDAALVSAGNRELQGAVPADPVLLVDVFATDAAGTRGALLDQVAAPLGRTVPALDGAVDISVADMSMWAGFQISHPAGRRLLLTGACLLLIGLTGALWIGRRRVWLEIEPSPGRTAVTLTAATADGQHAAHAESTALADALSRHVEGSR